MSESNVIEKHFNGSRESEASVYSIIGHREYQQDYACLLADTDNVLGVICDGMGGLNGGELASRTAVEILAEDYRAMEPEADVSAFLCREAVKMDKAVFSLRDEHGLSMKAGSTAVAVVVRQDQLYWMSVGDSRIYILRDGSMMAVTKDHNYRLELQEALDHGEISRETFETEAGTRKAEALISYLGMGGLTRIECNSQPFRLETGDTVLLCSDGLYKSLDEHQIKALLTDNLVSARVAAKRLVQMALEKAVKSQDNTTAVVIKYGF